MLLAAAGCSDSDSDPEPQATSKFQVVFEELKSTVFSVWGSSPEDVWLVGADVGSGPLVLHFDGDDWQQYDTGLSGTLWWVSGKGDDVWMSGEGGLVARYSRSEESFEALSVADSATLFGIYPLGGQDVWAVGGDARESRGVAYHYDGESFSPVADLPEAAQGDALFKVWGSSSDDLWIVGLGSVALHRTSDTWQVLPTPGRLFTVHGAGQHVLGVGGYVDGVIVENSKTELEEVTPRGLPQMNGVYVKSAKYALAVGTEGAIWAEREHVWAAVPEAPVMRDDYHSVFIDSEGGEWIVGGRLAAEPFNHGVLVYRGPKTLPDSIEKASRHLGKRQ